jgi:hypothetical protein
MHPRVELRQHGTTPMILIFDVFDHLFFKKNKIHFVFFITTNFDTADFDKRAQNQA